MESGTSLLVLDQPNARTVDTAHTKPATPFETLRFDISGLCNARCPWCTTGIEIRAGRPKTGRFVPYETFVRAIDYMRDRGIITAHPHVHLYSWGEPFLNPDFVRIIEFLDREGIRFGLSTNASRAVLFERNVMRNLTHILFSMPGFSQQSYDRVHGFDFQRITRNIAAMIDNYRARGFVGNAVLVYHVYRFNQDELGDARNFAREHQIDLYATPAYFNDFRLFLGYLKSELPPEQRRRAEEDLLLDHIPDQVRAMPPEYTCPEFETLTVDDGCRVLTCCSIGKGHVGYGLGNLFDLSLNEIRDRKVSQDICGECTRTGLSYVSHHPITTEYTYGRSPERTLLEIMEAVQSTHGRAARVWLFGAGLHTERLLGSRETWESRGHRVVGLIDDDPRFEESGTHLGLPVRSGDRFARAIDDGETVDAVVLSTDTHEERLWQRSAGLRERGVWVVGLYRNAG